MLASSILKAIIKTNFSMTSRKNTLLHNVHRSRETCTGCQQDKIIDLVKSNWRKRWICQSGTLAGRMGPWNRLIWKTKLIENARKLPSSSGPVHLHFFFFNTSFAMSHLPRVPMTVISKCPLDSWGRHNSFKRQVKYSFCFSWHRDRMTVQL